MQGVSNVGACTYATTCISVSSLYPPLLLLSGLQISLICHCRILSLFFFVCLRSTAQDVKYWPYSSVSLSFISFLLCRFKLLSFFSSQYKRSIAACFCCSYFLLLYYPQYYVEGGNMLSKLHWHDALSMLSRGGRPLVDGNTE